MGAPDHGRAGRQQALDGNGRAPGRRVGGEPVRMAEAGAVSGDVERILDGEGQAGERALARTCEGRVVVAAEGPAACRFSG
jgi:hypothetical protein